MSSSDMELRPVVHLNTIERYGLCKLILGLLLELLIESMLEGGFRVIDGPLKRVHRCGRWVLIQGVVTGGRGWRAAYSRERCDLILGRLELVVEISGRSEVFW
jgi:hypothetical protein